jgi:hypothetical protein
MRTDWVPSADADLDAFAVNFEQKITAFPATYGLLVGDATAFNTLADDFAAKLATATNPATRTSVAIAAKNTARAALVAALRSLARRVQAHPGITPAQLTEIGLTVRDTTSTPIAPPITSPVLAVEANNSRRHTLRLVDSATPLSRARPFGAMGASVYSYTGEGAPPASLEQWRHEGVATRSSFDVNYDANEVGKTAYLRAVWFNRRGQVGPMSDVITGTVAA